MIEEILEQIEGATIASSYIEDDDGFHICLTDGRVIVIAGHFGIAILPRSDMGKLH